jgi:mannan endo-1,4-beta-mannosidase
MKAPRILATALATAAAVLAAACGSQSSSTTAHGKPMISAILATPPAPAPASVVGFTGPGVPQSWAAVAAFGDAIGRPVSLAMYYSGWGENFQTAFADTARLTGAEVMVNLAPGGSLVSIAKGTGDGYLRRLAAQIKAFGHPVVLAFGHEANGKWYSYGYTHQGAAQYVAAYRRVHDVITKAGALNITWLWTVNIPDGAGTGRPAADWPGAAYVSEIGIDGYDWTGRETFAQEFGPTIAAVRRLGPEPVLIAETSVVHGPNAASQVTGLLNGVRADGLAGLVWFDTDKTGFKHTNDTHDWRLQDDPAALTAFRAAIRDWRP